MNLNGTIWLRNNSILWNLIFELPSIREVKITGQSSTSPSLCLFAHLQHLNIWPSLDNKLFKNKQPATSTTTGCWLFSVSVCYKNQTSFSFTCFFQRAGFPFSFLSPAHRSGKQAVTGRNRERRTGLCGSPPGTLTHLWQCPIVRPPSCGRSFQLWPGIPWCQPAGASPLPRHAAGQISLAGHRVVAVLLHHRRPQLNLQANRFGPFLVLLIFGEEKLNF